MIDTAAVRRANMAAVRALLRGGGCYSKQDVMRATGLSQATCNTLLNELARTGEVRGEKLRRHEVGRATTGFRLDEDHESALLISLDNEGGEHVLRQRVVTPLGTLVEESTCRGGKITERVLLIRAQEVFARVGNVSCVCLGVPGVLVGGEVRTCDLPELEGAHAARTLENALGVPVHMENDMYLKAYGFYRDRCEPGDIVTLCYVPVGVLPGTASIYAGTVVRGASQFAGQVGFMPFGLSYDEVQEAFGSSETAAPLMGKMLAALVTVLNPGTIVLSGELADARLRVEVDRACAACVPPEHRPELLCVESFDAWYRAGMLLRALEEKDGRL